MVGACGRRLWLVIRGTLLIGAEVNEADVGILVADLQGRRFLLAAGLLDRRTRRWRRSRPRRRTGNRPRSPSVPQSLLQVLFDRVLGLGGGRSRFPRIRRSRGGHHRGRGQRPEPAGRAHLSPFRRVPLTRAVSQRRSAGVSAIEERGFGIQRPRPAVVTHRGSGAAPLGLDPRQHQPVAPVGRLPLDRGARRCRRRPEFALFLQHERLLEAGGGGAGLNVLRRPRGLQRRSSGPPRGRRLRSVRNSVSVASGIAIATIPATATTASPTRTGMPKAGRPVSSGLRPAVTSTEASRSSATASTGICHIQSTTAVRQNADATGERGGDLRALGGPGAHGIAPTGHEDHRQEGGEEEEPDDSQLPERLQVQGMGVAHRLPRVSVSRPPEFEGSGAGAGQRLRGVLVEGGAPELVATLAGDAAEAPGPGPGAASPLEFLPAVRRAAGSVEGAREDNQDEDAGDRGENRAAGEIRRSSAAACHSACRRRSPPGSAPRRGRPRARSPGSRPPAGERRRSRARAEERLAGPSGRSGSPRRRP